MTVQQLIDLLAENFDPGDPVQFVFQPNYPLTAGLDRAVVNPESGTVNLVLTDATGYADSADVDLDGAVYA